MDKAKTRNLALGLVAVAATGGTLCLASYLRRKRRRPVIAQAPPPTKGLPSDARILVVTRIHGQYSAQSFESGPLRAFLQAAVLYADAVAIAVDVGDVLLPRLVVAVRDVVREFPGSPEIHIIPVSPWGKFVPALNAAVSFAATQHFSHVLFQSLETTITRATYDSVTAAFDPQSDLVVGAAMQGHEFVPGVHVLSGVTSPWNTLALWRVDRLCLTGFVGVAEGPFDGGKSAGIEEVSVIALLQFIYSRHSNSPSEEGMDTGENGFACVAKLVRLPGVSWDVKWDDPVRADWHRKKMAGKVSRAEAQMQRLGIPNGTVWHVEV